MIDQILVMHALNSDPADRRQVIFAAVGAAIVAWWIIRTMVRSAIAFVAERSAGRYAQDLDIARCPGLARIGDTAESRLPVSHLQHHQGLHRNNRLPAV